MKHRVVLEGGFRDKENEKVKSVFKSLNPGIWENSNKTTELGM